MLHGVTKVTAASLFLLLAALAGGLFAGAGSAAPAASTAACVFDPQLNHVTINQGLPYTRLVRGKETLARFYLSLPASIPRCGNTSRSIKITAATLVVKNGATVLTTTPINAQVEAINAEVTNTAPTTKSPSIPINSPADPKFVVPGGILAPSGVSGTFTASFEATIRYQSKGNDGVFTTDRTRTFTSFTPPGGTSTPASKLVEGPTRNLRVLVVPMGGALDQAASSAVGAGMSHLARIFPVPDGTPGARTAELTSTAGVLRYTVNSGVVNLTGIADSDGRFCGTPLNFAQIQTQLQAFRNAWNGVVNGVDSPQEQDADKVVAVVPEARSISSTSGDTRGCLEGFAMTNSNESWIRAVSNMAGPLFAMEICHTFGCVADTGTYHSLYTNADGQDPDRAYNVLDRAFIANDRTAMRLITPWTHENTVMEKDHFAYLLCGFGGANTNGCPAAPATGTLTGVAATAGSAFAVSGTTDGTAAGTTVSSMKSTGAPLTVPDPVSPYRLVQKSVSGTVLKNEGIPVRFDISHHGGGADSSHHDLGSFNVAYVAEAAATTIELRFNDTVLYSRSQNNAPTITDVSTGDGDVIPLAVWKSASPSGATAVVDAKPTSTRSATTQRLPSLKPVQGKVGSVSQRTARLVHLSTKGRLSYPAHQFGPFGSPGIGRFFATTYVVNTGTDPASPDGVCDETQCTLREAITLANGNPGLDTIEFTTAGVDAETPLPTITDPVTIDGTQADGTPALIELNGGGVTGTTTAGLRVGAGGGGTTIRRLVIVRFPGPAIVLEAGNNVIERNHIGATIFGTGGPGNGTGILVQSDDNTIGGVGGAGNLISANSGAGVFIDGNSFFVTSASRNRVLGNLIGTTLSGNTALGNGASGVGISGPRALNNIIGGTTADARNVISANSGGITVGGNPGVPNNTVIEGNYVGTNAAGNAALGNTGAGITVGSEGNRIGGTEPGAGNVISANGPNAVGGEGIHLTGANNTVQGNFIGTDATGATDLGNGFRGILVQAGGNVIGGTSSAARNVVSGNNNFSIHVGSGSGTQILGNYIGTTAAGTGRVANGAGIQVNANSNTIGGTASGAGNVISGNDGDGLAINGGSNVVQGNRIGTDASGAALGNGGRGVFVLANLGTPESGVQNTIGGTAEGAGNVIANNGLQGGVVISGGTGNGVLSNSIFANTGVGIDLGPTGVTGNDVGDGDTGANNLQNFPVVATATLTGSTTAVTGLLDGEAVGSYRLEFFGNGEACDGTHGEGRTFIGATTVASNDAGDVVFEESFSGLSNGDFVTATATDPNGNTSEFSECRQVTGSGGGGGDPTTFTVNSANDADDGACTILHCSLREAISATNTAPGAQTIAFAIGSGSQNISPTSALPTITDAVTIDGTTQPGYSGTPIIQLVGNLAPAGTSGLAIATGSTTVRGLVIRRFDQHGILITGAASTNNVIEGNYIGTDISGSEDSGNAREGIRVESPSATIGGTDPSDRNVVSGNNGHGILLFGSTGSTVEGNYAGTNAAGTAGIPNGIDGIIVDGGGSNTIGGTAEGAGNLASGNMNQGIAIAAVGAFTGSSGNVVQGNKVGTNAAGTGGIPNGINPSAGDGIRVDSASNTTIGGTTPGAANIVAFNRRGIAVFAVGTKTATGNRISGNEIHSNSDIGIDLGRDGVTANDLGSIEPFTHPDSDTGPNNRQNFPVLRSVVNGTISGHLDSTPDTTFTIEFFSNHVCDTSGNGEGARFLGSRTVTTNGSGRAQFTSAPPLVATGEYVTATATDPSGNTSEFSACRRAIASAEGTTPVTIEGTDETPGNVRAFVFANCGDRQEPIIVDRAPDDTSGNNYFLTFDFDPKPACAGPDGQLTLTVVTTDGFATSAPATVTVESPNEAPSPSIATDGPFMQWDGITLHGSAFDAEEQLGGGALDWSAPSLFSGTRTGFAVDLTPSPSWTPGTHTVTLTATDTPGLTNTITKTITIVGDADHDGCPTGTDLNDGNRYDAYQDADSDGRYNCEDAQPNVPDTSFTGTATFQPDPLVLPYNGVVTMTMRLLNKNVADVKPSSVRLLRIDGQNVSTDDAFKATSVAVTNTGVLRATFSGPAISNWLIARDVRDRRILVTMGGTSKTTPQWSFEGTGSTYVRRG